MLNFLNNKKIYWILFATGILLLILLQYFGVFYYQYPVPPGHDAMMHWNMAQPFYRSNVDLIQYIKSGAYPPGFLVFISETAHLFNTDMMEIIKWFAPSIIVVAAIAMFLLVYYIFNPIAALLAFYFYSFTAKIQIQQLNDGGYPNLIAAQIFLPLLLLSIFLFLKNKRLINKILFGGLSLILFIAIPFTHHITTLYLVALIAISPIVVVIYKIVNKDWQIKKGLICLIGLIGLLVLSIYFFLNSELFASTRNLLNMSIQVLDIFPFIKFIGTPDPEALVGLRSYPGYIGPLVFLFGCAGIVTLPFIRTFKNKVWLFPVVILALLLLIGSRLNFLSNPDRLLRDLVYPLSILAGLFIYYASIFLAKKNKFFLYVFIIIILSISIRGLIPRVSKAIAYEPMVRITDADMAAINYLKTQAPGKILIEGYSFYFERFLPGWPIDYLWGPATYQPASTHPYNPKNGDDLAILEKYNYVYIVESQTGWTPSAVKFNFASEYLNDYHFELKTHNSSQTNEIYLFKINQ